MVSWGSAVVLVLMILVFGFYFQLLWISIALAVVILLLATATGKSTPATGASTAPPPTAAPAQAAPPQQVIVIKEQVQTKPHLAGWKPTWSRSPVPITLVDAHKFDPLWVKLGRGIGGQIGKGLRTLMGKDQNKD